MWQRIQHLDMFRSKKHWNTPILYVTKNCFIIHLHVFRASSQWIRWHFTHPRSTHRICLELTTFIRTRISPTAKLSKHRHDDSRLNVLWWNVHMTTDPQNCNHTIWNLTVLWNFMKMNVIVFIYWEVSTPTLYFRGPGFKFRPRSLLYWQNLHDFPQSF